MPEEGFIGSVHERLTQVETLSDLPTLDMNWHGRIIVVSYLLIVFIHFPFSFSILLARLL